MFLRACMRYTTIYITAARATSKTFLSILAKYLQCVFVPGHIGSIVAPNKIRQQKFQNKKLKRFGEFGHYSKMNLKFIIVNLMQILVKTIVTFSSKMVAVFL